MKSLRGTGLGLGGALAVGAWLALVACGGVSEQPPPAGTPGSAGKAGDEVADGSNQLGSSGAGIGTAGTLNANPAAGGSGNDIGGSAGGGNGRLPARGPFDSVGVSAPPQDCHSSGVGTCCNYEFCLDAEDTRKALHPYDAGGAGGAPPDIADVCYATDTRVGFCGEIRTTPSVKDGKCCFTVNSGDCC